MSTDKRIIEAIPPRRQWDPRIVSGVKRVNSGEDPDKVALDLAMVVPEFSRTQLGAYTAAYNKDLEKRRLARKKEGNDRKAIIVVPPESLAEDEDGRLAAINGERVTVSSYQYADGDFYVRTKALGRVSVPGTWLRDVTGKHPFDAEAIGLKEGLFSAGEPDVADRDNKERAVQALLGSEDVDVKKVPDEKLSGLIQGLGSITTESIDSQVAQIVSVMREQKASRNDVLEALRVHVGFSLREAREVLQEYLREGAKQHAETLTPGERSHYKPGSKRRVIKEATTDITYYANYLRKQFQGLSFTVAGLDKDMVIHVLAAFHYYFDKEEDPDSAMKILSKKWTAGEWGYTTAKGKIPGAKEAKALPRVVRWYNDFLDDREPLQEGAPKERNVRKVSEIQGKVYETISDYLQCRIGPDKFRIADFVDNLQKHVDFYIDNKKDFNVKGLEQTFSEFYDKTGACIKDVLAFSNTIESILKTSNFLEDREALQEGAPEEGNVRKVDYKGYTITVHKNRAGMYTAKNDSGEPYTNVPQFRSEEEAIAWDKKNVDQMTESSSPTRTGVRYGVFSRGGSVGSKHNGPIETFDNVEDAKQYAARLRKTLTPGERSYYKMGYVVRALKEAKEAREVL